MAKPIKITPKLKGEDAKRFLKEMIIVESSRINLLDRRLAEEIKREKHLLKVI